MCTNKKYVTNKYTGQRLIVNCGHCASCLQQKANKVAQRIRNSIDPETDVAISITLTYANDFVPYILRKDIENPNCYEYPIYRDSESRRFKGSTLVRSGRHVVGMLRAFDSDTGEVFKEGCDFVPNLNQGNFRFNQEKMGVLLYSDIQRFFKRFRQVLSRRYGLENAFRSFQCSELGETHYRPHFHTVLITKRENFEFFRNAFFESWTYADSTELYRCFEEARDMASYLASYVNSNTDIPQIFRRLSAPKHSLSKNFGVETFDFRLPKILEKTDVGDLTYNRITKYCGVPTVFNIPIPKYVINRYFPYIKGLSRLSSNSLANLLRFPFNGFRYHKDESLTNYVDAPLPHEQVFKYQNVLDLGSKNDTWRNYICLRHCIDNYIRLTGKTSYDYAIDYVRVWNCYKNTLYRKMFEDTTNMFELYDNIADYFNGNVRSYSLDDYQFDRNLVHRNFNEFSKTVEITDYYSSLYYKKKKHKKTNSFIYSHKSKNF